MKEVPPIETASGPKAIKRMASMLRKAMSQDRANILSKATAQNRKGISRRERSLREGWSATSIQSDLDPERSIKQVSSKILSKKQDFIG